MVFSGGYKMKHLIRMLFLLSIAIIFFSKNSLQADDPGRILVPTAIGAGIGGLAGGGNGAAFGALGGAVLGATLSASDNNKSSRRSYRSTNREIQRIEDEQYDIKREINRSNNQQEINYLEKRYNKLEDRKRDLKYH